MGGFAIRNLITLARTEGEGLAVGVHDFQFAFETERHMSFGTPMICRIAGRVFHHANADLAEILRPPQRRAGVSGMLRGRHLTPIRDGERKPGHLHGSSIARSLGRRGATMEARGWVRRVRCFGWSANEELPSGHMAMSIGGDGRFALFEIEPGGKKRGRVQTPTIPLQSASG
jgi:hypothetical protein